MIGCHWCGFEAKTLREVWRHEEEVHPVERAEEDVRIEDRLRDPRLQRHLPGEEWRHDVDET